MIERRALLRGLFAMPAIVAIDSLMPIRGIVMPVRYNADVDLLIRGLIDDGIWQKMDWLWDCRNNHLIINEGDRFRMIEPAISV
jgi:hypothetical protein